MNAREAVWLVARREIITRMRSKAYLIMTLLMMASVVAISVGMKLTGGGDSPVATLGVLNGSVAAPLRATAAAVGVDVTTRNVSDQTTGERQVRDGTLDALVTGPPLRVVVNKNLPDDLRNALTALARQQALDQQITLMGGDPAAVSRAVATATLQVRALQPAESFQSERIAVSSIAGILVYLALLIYGQRVAQGVVEEKASRIVEILLTVVRPWQLMFGKVLGIGVTGLVQMLAVAVAGVSTALATGSVSMPATLLTTAVAWAVVWFLVGFLGYALIFAAMGSLVSRQEDAGAVVAPVMSLIIVPYILGISILPSQPDSGLVRTLSLIPFFSPTLMPMRAALGAPAWEQWMALALTVLCIAALVRLAGRIYRNAVLRTGTRIKLSDALRDA